MTKGTGRTLTDEEGNILQSAGFIPFEDPLILPVADVEFVKELYPRLREDDAAIGRYRAAIDRLPPITVARGRVLVDGYHRLQAHKLEQRDEIRAHDLGNLTDIEIMKESIRRNAAHGKQLETPDKRRNADLLYRRGTTLDEIIGLLSITEGTARKYVADARRDEKADQQAKALDLWLDCWTQEAIATELDITRKTVREWVGSFGTDSVSTHPPESRQHFNLWNFPTAGDDKSYFGKMPEQVVENLLWFYTEPGDVVVDLFAGTGTTIDVAKRMGRRVWASDRKPYTETLPIHSHDATSGWPDAAPNKARLVILDPPYWVQAKGRYSQDDDDLGNMTLDDFMTAWKKTVTAVVEHADRVAYIVSPADLSDSVVDLAWLMLEPFGKVPERRIIVPYNTQQVNGAQVEMARKNKRMLSIYRDLVIV